MLNERFQIEQRGPVVIVNIEAGDLTSLEVDELLTELIQYKEQAGALFFVLDMSQVDFIDSACIGSLLTFLIDVDKVSGRIALASCQPPIEQLIQITGLTTHLQLSSSVEEAVAAIAA